MRGTAERQRTQRNPIWLGGMVVTERVHLTPIIHAAFSTHKVRAAKKTNGEGRRRLCASGHMVILEHYSW